MSNPGEANNERVKAICEKALLTIKIGKAFLERKPGPCHCKYSDGSYRFVTPSGRLKHVCGR